MSRIAYVNGRYLPHGSATLHIEDRGTQFADAVYEVCEIVDGAMIDATAHLDRLARSLGELAMDWPVTRPALLRIMMETARRNRVHNGIVYVQVSRGIARRDHGFPGGASPTLTVTSRRIDPATVEAKANKGMAVVTVPDNRWERVDIKTTGLLPNVMARQQALDAGAAEAWFVDADGLVTEGASTNAWIVTGEGTVVTRPATDAILRGITRATAIKAARALGIAVEERPFSVEEAMAAREAFVTSATSRVQPVVAINDRPIANGHPGTTTMALRDAYLRSAEQVPVRRVWPVASG